MRIIRGSTSSVCHGSDTMHEAQWAGPEGHWVASCGRGARGAGESGRGASRNGKQGRRQKHVMARARAANERERKRRHADERTYWAATRRRGHQETAAAMAAPFRCPFTFFFRRVYV